MNPSTEIIQPGEVTPDLALMERADLPAIWGGYREQALKLKETAETLTITDAGQKSEMQIARSTRLALRQIRIAVEAKRVELKEDIVRKGRGIDTAANELKALIEPLEARLREQEEFALRLEVQRKADLVTERSAKLLPFGVDPKFLNLAEMPDADFDQLLANSRSAHETKIEAARKAEAERVAREQAEAEERERIRQDNARLRDEAEERERAAKVERERVEQERREAAAALEKERQRVEVDRLAAAEQARKERVAVETAAAEERRAAAEKAARELATQRAEARRQQEESDCVAAAEKARLEAIAAKEREARERLEREAKAKAAREEAARKAAEKAAKDAAKAPDKVKLAGFATMVRGMAVPTLTTLEGLGVGREVEKAVRDFAVWIEGKAASL